MTHKERDNIKETPTNSEQYWTEMNENQIRSRKIISSSYSGIHMDLTDSTLDEENRWREKKMRSGRRQGRIGVSA